MMRTLKFIAIVLLLLASAAARDKKVAISNAREQYLRQLTQSPSASSPSSLGSLWRDTSIYTNLLIDYKARQLGDPIAIILMEQTLTEASGSVATSRDFQTANGISGLAGKINVSGLQNLLSGQSSTKLQGSGQTASKSSLQTRLGGEVIAVLPNGSLAVEARRQVTMSNQTQTVILRGVVRPGDVTSDNTVVSTQMSNLEVEVKGKGVISDSTRPPNFIVRLLLRIIGF